MKKETLRLAASGLLAGAANGLLGAGGGMILVPLLTGWCRLDDKRAFATALAIILPLCLVSLGVYCTGGAVELSVALPYLIGGFAGGLLGGLLFRRVSAAFLHRALGAVILFGGVRLLWPGS